MGSATIMGSEFRNVLALQLRHQILTLQEALKIMYRAENLIHGGEYDVPSTKVLELAQSSGCSAYDCEFVVLAQDLGVHLVTADRQLLTRFPDIAISPEDYVRSSGADRR